MNIVKRKLGWLHDKPDPRDLNFSVQFRLPVKLPPSMDLRSGCSPVEDQGNLGSCVGNAIVGADEFLEIKSGTPFKDLSRLFAYYNARRDKGADTGATIRDGIKALVKYGVCREDRWPYDVAQFAIEPPNKCYAEAYGHRITAYQRLTTLTDMKACLAGGFPFVFGFDVFKSAMTDAVAKTGDIPMPSRWERITGAEGGHAVMGSGYLDKSGKINFRNSWGKEWGDGGYGTLDFDYIQKYASDFWCIQKSQSDLYALSKIVGSSASA